MFKKILDSFPPPELLLIPFAGLSISDTAIRCVQFEKKTDGLIISKFTEREISTGLVVNGFIQKPKEVSQLLKTLKTELHLDFVRVSLPEEKAYLFTTTTPVVKNHKEIRGSIEFKIEENVPLPGSELIFDYHIIEADPKKDHISVVVSALPSAVVDLYVETIRDAELELLSLEIESQAVARAVIPENNHDTYLIVHFSKEKVGLYVASKRLVHFTSTVSVKEQNMFDPAFLSTEIKKLNTYWHTLKENENREDRKIKQIFLCGEDLVETLATQLGGYIGTPIQLANVWVNAFDVNKLTPPIPFIDSLRYTSTVGLALPSDILI